MTVRRLAAVLLAVALLSPSAFAAKGKTARQTTPLESLQYVVKQLDLTPDQQPKADQILADLEQKLTDLKHQARAAAHPTGKRATKLSPTTKPDVTGTAKDALLAAEDRPADGATAGVDSKTPAPAAGPMVPGDPAAIARQNLLERIRAARANLGGATGKMGGR